MAAINVDKMSLKELVALEGKIKGAIAEARTKERAELKSKVAELAVSHGFSIAELFGADGRGKSKATGIAKYANPDDATDTWTGSRTQTQLAGRSTEEGREACRSLRFERDCLRALDLV